MSLAVTLLGVGGSGETTPDVPGRNPQARLGPVRCGRAMVVGASGPGAQLLPERVAKTTTLDW